MLHHNSKMIDMTEANEAGTEIRSPLHLLLILVVVAVLVLLVLLILLL